MAKLTAVCRSDDYQFERRQLPLVIDDTLTMVIQFSETCVDCGHMCGVKQKELETFVRRFSSLSKDEIAVAMMVTSKEILTALAHMVPCVGCRRSVERLFSQLTASKYPALEPLVIIPGGVLSINSDCLFDPRAIYALFYIHGTQLTSVVDSIPKSKKNKRCMLHSLDTHKSRASSNWMDIWSVLSQECREEVVLVDADCLLDTLDNYLRKHRFCAECKSKVMRAYKILVGDVDCTKEKGYCPGLYEGLRCCPQERHVHIRCSTKFIADLIGRAEPELAGRRDRHAKTLDIAQEEVLTCLGIHIYDRLHRIWQKLHAEEQTWQILFYLGVDALKKNFELALEKKQGVSNLELMCEELLEEERAKEQKRQQKRQKRKKKRAKNETGDLLLDNCIDNCEPMPEEQVSCKCETIQNSPSHTSATCSPRPVNKIRYSTDPNSNTEHVSVQSCRSCNGGRQLLGRGADPLGGSLGGSRSSDAGYSSGADDRCDNCSVPSSNDGSDVVCSDSPTCNHHGCDVLCPSCYVDECKECRTQNNNPSSHSSTAQCKLKYPNRAKHSVTAAEVSPSNGDISMNGGCRMALTLQDMLEQSCSSEEDAELISEEEIKHFRANQKSLQRERQELRETLRQRFHSLQQRGGRANDGDERCSPDLDQLAERLCNL